MFEATEADSIGVDLPEKLRSGTCFCDAFSSVDGPFKTLNDENDEYMPISPHYARHWFSTWFRTQPEMAEPKIQYLRGDKMGPDIDGSWSAFHRYVHTHYDDVMDEYREGVFKLGI